MNEAFVQFVPYLLIFAVFWFLLIAPQRKIQKAKEELRKNLKKGDRVVTAGGLHGEVVKVEENKVVLKVSDKTHCVFDLGAIDRAAP